MEKNCTDKILKIKMRNLETGQDNYKVTLTIKDLNKLIREHFGLKDNTEIAKVILLENCWNERTKASRKIY